jgi:hypothetical protein
LNAAPASRPSSQNNAGGRKRTPSHRWPGFGAGRSSRMGRARRFWGMWYVFQYLPLFYFITICADNLLSLPPLRGYSGVAALDDSGRGTVFGVRLWPKFVCGCIRGGICCWGTRAGTCMAGGLWTPLHPAPPRPTPLRVVAYWVYIRGDGFG